MQQIDLNRLFPRISCVSRKITNLRVEPSHRPGHAHNFSGLRFYCIELDSYCVARAE